MKTTMYETPSLAGGREKTEGGSNGGPCDCEGKLDGLCCRGESYLLIGMQRDRRGSTLLVACQGRAVRQDRAALRGAARGRLDVGQADTYF